MTEEELKWLLKSEDLREFIESRINEDPAQTALKYSGKTPFPLRAAIEQIRCRKKAGIKIPAFSGLPLIYEPVALEQASSEITAAVKTTLIGGDKLIDLTGGLGIDDTFFSKNFTELVYCEQNPLLSSIFTYNSYLLKLTNVEIKTGNSIDILKEYPDNYFSWIYADPARRDESRRFIGLEACSPNIVENLPLLKSKSENILIKASPALETGEIKRLLPGTEEIIVLSVNGECREILIVVRRKNTGSLPVIKALIISQRSGVQKIRELQGIMGDIKERKTSPRVLDYFFEPDAAIIKSRLTAHLAEQYDLLFVNHTVDFLTSMTGVDDFPGRVFRTLEAVSYSKRTMSGLLKKYGITSANIARRDFPDPPEVIRKNLRLKDGGSDYLFFTRDQSGDYIAVYCRKA